MNQYLSDNDSFVDISATFRFFQLKLKMYKKYVTYGM